jgi:hypothetical protein
VERSASDYRPAVAASQGVESIIVVTVTTQNRQGIQDFLRPVSGGMTETGKRKKVTQFQNSALIILMYHEMITALAAF